MFIASSTHTKKKRVQKLKSLCLICIFQTLNLAFIDLYTVGGVIKLFYSTWLQTFFMQTFFFLVFTLIKL